MDVRKFRTSFGRSENVQMLIVPVFAVHTLTAQVISDLLYNRPGIRPIQKIKLKFCTTRDEPEIDSMRSLRELQEPYLNMLESRKEVSGNNFREKLLMASDFRVILLRSETEEKDVRAALEAYYGDSADLNGIRLYKTVVFYSYWNQSLSSSLKKLFQSIEPALKQSKNSTSNLQAEGTWDDFFVHSFEQVGHIAHLNLPSAFHDEDSQVLKDAKFIIGCMILDHHPHLSIVINKTKNIESEFREMAIEILAVRPPMASSSERPADTFYFIAEQDKNSTISPILYKSLAYDATNKFDDESLERSYYTQVLPENSPIFTVRDIKHNDCIFSFSIFHCFFNKRLEEEHRKLKTLVLDKNCLEDVVFDVFAGVGPISVPLAKKRVARCTDLVKKRCKEGKVALVHANDLNPMCHRYLAENGVRNKLAVLESSKTSRSVKMPRISPSEATAELSKGSLYIDIENCHGKPLMHAWNMDGLEFIEQSLELWKAQPESSLESPRFCHFFMNLPGSAAESFLTPFGTAMESVQFYKEAECWSPEANDGIIVHCHTFATNAKANSGTVALEKVYAGLVKLPIERNVSYDEFIADYLIQPPHSIRNVAPRKEMVRVSFALNRETVKAFRKFRM